MLISNFHLELCLNVIHLLVVHEVDGLCEFVAVVLFSVLHRHRHLFPLFVRVRLCQALFVDLSDKGVTLSRVGAKIPFKLGLFFMHCRFVFERVLVQDLVFFLACGQPLAVTFVVLELFEYVGLGVVGTHGVVLYFDFVDFALANQLLVLVVSDLPLFAGLKLLPGFLFNHCSVGIQVLSLQLNLLQLFGKSFLLNLFVCFLFVNVFISL